jgi:hypothetical protein
VADSKKGGTHTATSGGIAGIHPVIDTPPVYVAPSTNNEFNRVVEDIRPIACWGLGDARFAFGSSFLRPEVAEDLPALAELCENHPGAPLSIFGHADPIGDEGHNKKLSGRRARSVYGALLRDTQIWEDLYNHPLRGDSWGVKSIQTMLEDLGHRPGPIDGIEGDQTRAAVVEFQKSQGLAADGVVGPVTRAKLFRAYMDKNCQDAAGKQFQLKACDFLARGANAKGKGDYQGCSEFNLALIFSRKQAEWFKKPENFADRDEANEPNRRVIVFLFAPGTQVDPDQWPCAEAETGITHCQDRFWSDWKRRLGTQEQEREFRKTHDTFACRFYQRLSRYSPCELQALTRVWIDIQTVDEYHVLVPNCKLALILPDGSQRQIQTDEWGYHREARLPEGELKVMLEDGSTPAKFQLKDEERDAIVHTAWAGFTITKVIVSHTASKKYRKRQRVLDKLYRRSGTYEEVAGRNDPVDRKTREHTGNVETVPTHKSMFVAVDNVFMTVGFDKHAQVPLPEFFDALRGWLEDRYSTPLRRGYFLELLTFEDLTVYDEKGTVLGKFPTKSAGSTGKGTPIRYPAAGAYAALENTDHPVFFDLSGNKFAAGVEGLEVDESGNVPLDRLLQSPDDGAKLKKIVSAQRDKVRILYMLPTGIPLRLVIRNGGFGRLESYNEITAKDDTASDKNKHIHQRNMAVIKTLRREYEWYLDDYINSVKACKEPDEIQALGPPLAMYTFATPAGASKEQAMELAEEQMRSSSLRAWEGISDRLERLSGEIPDGSIYFQVKLEAAREGHLQPGGEIRTSLYFEKDGTPVLMDPEYEIKIAGSTEGKEPEGHEPPWPGPMECGASREVSIDPKTGEVTNKIKAIIGPAEVEFADSNEFKFEMKAVHGFGGYMEAAAGEGRLGYGAFYEIKKGLKIFAGIYIQGLRKETVAAYFANTRGFFSHRPTKMLLDPKVQWDDLYSDEQELLEVLGWSKTAWDIKHVGSYYDYPESTRKPYGALSEEEKAAARALYIYGDMWKETWIKLAESNAPDEDLEDAARLEEVEVR